MYPCKDNIYYLLIIVFVQYGHGHWHTKDVTDVYMALMEKSLLICFGHCQCKIFVRPDALLVTKLIITNSLKALYLSLFQRPFSM